MITAAFASQLDDDRLFRTEKEARAYDIAEAIELLQGAHVVALTGAAEANTAFERTGDAILLLAEAVTRARSDAIWEKHLAEASDPMVIALTYPRDAGLKRAAE